MSLNMLKEKKRKRQVHAAMFQSYLDLAGDPGKEGELGKMKKYFK